ncbi:MAG: hypothetical protein LBR35_00050 [Rickettsiales bacterium]|jgi:hypothetical protein|nr:hypothetical protein [Rickettsiales bacterium]
MENEVQIPQKFKDKETGGINASSLLKSYLDLEKKLSSKNDEISDLPKDYQDYDLGDDVEPDEELNKKLHENKFTQKQAKCFYEIINGDLKNKLKDAESLVRANNDLSFLESHFGGKDSWHSIAQQLNAFGQSNLDSKLYDVLSSSRDGILLLHEMMKAQEPQILDTSSSNSESVSLDSLRKMMNDPKYWRDNDPDFCSAISKGFEKLYR